MAPSLLVEYTKKHSDKGLHFNYEKFMVPYATRIPGAFRVVRVDPLLDRIPTVEVWQHPDIRWGVQGVNFAYKRRLEEAASYIALSHVWSHADDVDAKLNSSAVLRPFKVDVDEHNGINYKKLGWVGLQQIAKTAQTFKIRYMWIDFFCIDQISQDDNEMGLQICIMADIYRYARWVLVMIGGMGAVVPTTAVSGWMDRAWTLQEAVVNPKVWVLVLWDKTNMVVRHPRDRTKAWRFIRIDSAYKPGFDQCLVRLESLLDLADTNIPGVPRVRVVDGASKTPGDVARRVLRMALARRNPAIQYTGVWRSMYLRTSSKPADVVYSIMGIFALQIDPFRKNREPRYLFNDLARKTAAKRNVGPVWLTIGGVTGCDIPREPDSHIVLRFPHREPAGKESDNEPPTMQFQAGAAAEWVGYHVDDSRWYIKQYDMRFLSQSHPHIINAVMLTMSDAQSGIRVRKVPRVTPATWRNYVRRNVAVFTIGGYRAHLVWWGDVSRAVARRLQAVFVGEVGDMTKEAGGPKLNLTHETSIAPSPVSYRGMAFFLFMEYTNRHWHVVGDGVFSGPARHFRNRRRSIFTVGAGSQQFLSRWPVYGKTSFDACDWSLRNSYGVEPLRDWRVARNLEQEQRIQWFGVRNMRPERIIPWTTYTLVYDIDDLLYDPKLTQLNWKLRLETHPLSVVSTVAPARSLPSSARTMTYWPIDENEAVQIPFSYGGWSRSECSDLAKAGVDGILLHNPDRGSHGYVTYQVRLLFGKRVIYLQLKQDDTARSAWAQTYVVHYRYRGHPLRTINPDYIVNPIGDPHLGGG
ncbi:Heterokaryon incompatibility [Niveomyces insectorum RCEF 264]|uniref:Heterokaryon incompatibility n=1 Tax=Niveomyces insectorum RCEF 264 TaxID=1081102 RepID=A0A167LWM5_9HYPO|nr:Heterokaryon incompatibility [Niveomyces insectorum RCEF 264]